MSKRAGNWWLISSGVFFGLYCANVALGKLSLVLGWKPVVKVNDVTEFSILFAAVICLVIVMLQREYQKQNTEN
mgnify:CR=1 FL=1